MENRNKMKLDKKLILIIFAILTFLMLIFLNNKVYAAVDMTYYKGKLNTSTYYHVEQRDLWKNEYIYCIDPNSMVYEGDYTVSASFEVNSKEGKYAKSEKQGIQVWILANDGRLGFYKYNLTTTTYEEYLKTSAGQHLMWMAMETPCYRLPYKDFTYKGNTYKKWYYYDLDGNKKEYQGGNETYGPLWGTMPYVVEEEWKKIVGDPDNIVADMYPGYLNLLNYFKERKSIKKNNDSKLKVYYDADKSPVDGVSGSSITSDYDWKEKYIVIGPMTFDVATGDWLKDIKIDYTKNGEKYYNQSITSENTDIIACEKNVDGGFDGVTESYFKEIEERTYENILDGGCIYGKYMQPEVYILIKKDAGITSIDNIKITVGRGEIEAWWYELKLTGQQTLMYGDGKISLESTNLNYEVEPLIPPIQVELNKVDTAGAVVNGAQFKIEYDMGVKNTKGQSTETVTVKDGKITFTQAQPQSSESFQARITEVYTPTGYKQLNGEIILKFEYDEKEAKWKVTKQKEPTEKVTIGTISTNTKTGVNVIPVTVENKSIIEKLTILKTSSVGVEAVVGAKFKLTLTNVTSIKNYQIPTTGATQATSKTIFVTTDAKGNIVLEDIEIADLSKNVTIEIEETEAPVGYKKIDGKITVTLKREGNTYTVSETKKDNTVIDDEFQAGKVTLTNHELILNIKDIPVMNLGGIVWTEKIQTDKTTAEINNQYNGEKTDEALAGIKVTLYKDGKKVTETTSSDGNQKATYTDHKGNKVEVDLAKGEYMFTDITAGDDYYVVFEYDGIKYQAMTNSKEQAYTTEARDTKISKETNRDNFNKNTETISGNGKVDESKTNAGWIIEYDLDNDSTPNKAIYKDVKNENGELQYVEGKTYTYLSKTEDWMGTWNTDGTINKSHYAFNINCGLSKRFFDLSLGTDVKDATVTINGNQTTYTYDQILDGKLDEALNRPSSEKNIDYNLYLAVSDYNYRIADYKVPGEGAIENKYDDEALNKEQIESAKKDSELEVYVTYRIELKNQSTQHDAKVNKVEYHYDDKYAFLDENNKNINLTEGTNLENRVLMIDTSDLQINGGETKSLDLTFKVLPDGKGNKCVLGEDYLNQAEIISYTTGGGLVDEDSAPGNAFLEENKVRYEDDTDEANGIQIKLKDNAERSISGQVFDTNGNNVSDVIVQLIELVEINNQQYEYIWQETLAGSNTVKTTDRNGYPGKSYSFKVDDMNKAGEYKFTQGIIPGNYIVRFIYGDGRTYDITENTLKYNGEDYKSTYVDYDYNAEWYNTISLNGENSKAVDNEARRLKVMSYAVDVDGTKGEALALLDKNIGTNDEELKEVLSNTWMCAETLKIKMPVDSENKENTSDTTTIDDGSNPSIEYTQFNNVNFRLMERPKTKLVLEKHITGLTIKPVASGVNLIANATANISDILEGDTITLEGQKDGLFAIKSGRSNRGQWYLQTDTTELAQGADAYITYTYVIRNEGDEDYLNKDLVEFYNTANIKDYATKLSDLELEVKNAKKSITGKPYKNGTYISDFYYTGTKGDNDKEVLASVEQIQEALNPKVSFVNSTTDFTIIKDTDGNTLVEKKNVYKQDGTEIAEEEIKEQIKSVGGTKKLLQTGETLSDIQNKEDFIEKTMDTSKKLVISVGLSASEIENGGVYDSYIAEVTHYTNAAGRRDQSTPANLSYVHSYDTEKTLEKHNEEDEFWAETFRITKPTGEDKLTAVQIAIISVSAVVILGVGIILIKKFVLKK